MRGRPGYEHLNDPLHIIIEAELPANIVDMRLRQAKQIIEELLKPMVSFLTRLFFITLSLFHYIYCCLSTMKDLCLQVLFMKLISLFLNIQYVAVQRKWY